MRRPRRSEAVADLRRAERQGLEALARGAYHGAGGRSDTQVHGRAVVQGPQAPAEVLVHATGRDIALGVEAFPARRYVEAGEGDLWTEA